MLENICNWIVLISAVLIGLTNILKCFGKPIIFFKSKRDKEETEKIKTIVVKVLDEMLPEKFYEHDLETRDKYKSDRQQYLKEISADVTEAMTEVLQRQNEAISILTKSSKDVLREKIMAIYHKNKAERTLTYHEKEALEQYNKDYKEMKGNSYIDKYYGRMKKWAVLSDCDDEDEVNDGSDGE